MSRHEIIARWHSDAARTRHGALHLSRPIPFLERLDALNLKHQAVRATKAQSMRQAANSPESAARARGENWPWPSSHIDCYAPPKRASAASLVQRSRTRGAWAGRPASQSAIRGPGVHLPRTEGCGRGVPHPQTPCLEHVRLRGRWRPAVALRLACRVCATRQLTEETVPTAQVRRSLLKVQDQRSYAPSHNSTLTGV
jgi:hypothetical protein